MGLLGGLLGGGGRLVLGLGPGLGLLGGDPVGALEVLGGLGLGDGGGAGVEPLLEADGLAGPVAEVIQLGATDLARALHHDVGHARRVDRELPLHALALYDP